MCPGAAVTRHLHHATRGKNTRPSKVGRYNKFLLAQTFHGRVIRTCVLRTQATLTLSKPWSHRRNSGKAPIIIQLGTTGSPVAKVRNQPLYPRKNPGSRCTGGLADPTAGLNQLFPPTQPTGLCNDAAVCLIQAETELLYSNALI